jgi:hypothetical protein
MNVYLQIIVLFFLALNIDVLNILIYMFLSMEFVLIAKFIPNFQKLTYFLGIFLGYFFKSK